ncbi:DNA translocase FtsK [Aquibacillus albus]|uniref:S-DNA-T family DNA segregation ATPase FtsK/SpoIIIE n=1 Tax=Aquibacillus albus TaxID=1168171 RepID=A0ABS2N4N5_9BACI|nr:DNA translocase FtsK [Aquibacillus albus]MBM7572835.1 S-DNA-T family DNA segregation ATPase FtsK/SpoIIIE [Aquibacillus albus]
MWKQWKKKLFNLFKSTIDKENIDVQQKQEEKSNQQKVYTKISYQYPNNESFKFPIIPDRPTFNDSTDDTAYKRRLKRRSLEKQEVEERRPTPTNENKERKPFKAADVPSPVYGFRSRSNHEELDVPAFIRKEHPRLEEQDNHIAIERTELEANEDHTIHIEEHHEEEPIINWKERNQESKQKVREIEEESPNNTSENERKEKENIDQITDNHEPHSISPKKSIDENSNQKSKRDFPFNVIMTPSDKKAKMEANVITSKEPTFPPTHLLNDSLEDSTEDSDWVNQQKQLLTTTLKHFHVRAKVVNAMCGPTVTRFEIQPEPGVKVSKIKNLSDDIKLNLAAKDIRMEAPIPGKNTIGIEVPNPKSQPVMLQDIFNSTIFKQNKSPLSVALGLDIAGRPIITDLKKMPHGLIAGATGSGKSVCINTILISLLYKASHKDVRFLLIDPKMVELAPYNQLPHLVSPVITDVKAATSALKWAVTEMEERYEKFVHEGARDIERYNQKMLSQNRANEKMPYLVIVIDELADLMMVSPQDVEDAICRIAQKARACGIHLLVATQRPSVDVITGLIKANIPTRIAFSVSSQVDSRTIIDTNGAEKLLGRGDMLFHENGAGKLVRIQGAFVSDDEIERVTNYVKNIAPPNYMFEQEQLLQQITTEEQEDELYQQAVEFVVEQNGASASLLQRRFKVGYNRAARLIDHMEANGIISEQKGSKPRDVLITRSELASHFQIGHSNK